MQQASLVGERFEIRDTAGSGGMSTVYRAMDRVTASPVAVKISKGVDAEAQRQFAREARILEQIEHPHVVRCMAHGVTPEGNAFLVMEWLDGITLMDRLDMGPLSVDEVLELGKRISSGLGEVHLRGIVHRDIKPGNIFLQNGDVGRAKLLDFGIARNGTGQTASTTTGTLIGTPGYMAPEQARGPTGTIDQRIDIFSLGCVLFECLTGRLAFPGSHVLARLAKLLLEEPPRVRDLRPDVPDALDELISRMLAKNIDNRPANGNEVHTLLERVGVTSRSEMGRPAPSLESLTHTEKRLVSLVAVVPHQSEKLAAGQVSSAPKQLAELRRAVKAFGAKIEEIANGLLIAMLEGSGPATDQAVLAARCALRMRLLLPRASFAVITGRGEGSVKLPIGQVFENVASWFEHTTGLVDSEGRIWMDETTRALLDVRFEVIEENGRIWLQSERDVGSGARTLLGKPSPFVGRDRELRNLLEIIDEAIEERHSRVVLVTGEAGAGKSRLLSELRQRLKGARPEMVFSIGRGDSMGPGSPFGILASAFRSSLAISADEKADNARAKLLSIVNLYFDGEDAWRIGTFVGEMIGVPIEDESDPRVRAARQNPAIMASQIQQAYVELVHAVASQVPVVLVLEDLHWGDGVSVKLIDTAIREMSDRPYVVLAFARPEVHQVFPQLWSGRGLQSLALGGLTRRSAETLVKSILGESIDPDTVNTIVDRAGGNAFYLEELIRVVSEGRKETLPETVLGMVEARIAALAPEMRRILRAASVFGGSFWEESLKNLLRDDMGSDARSYLNELCARELIARRVPSRFTGEIEYGFRHALVREGAYAMLTDRDRALGHDLAAEWLLHAGEQDPLVLAGHFERGTNPSKAATYYARAAEQAMRGADFAAAIARAEKGIAVGADGEAKAVLHGVLAIVSLLTAKYDQCYEHATLVLQDRSIGVSVRALALGYAVVSAVFLGKYDAFAHLFPEILSVEPAPDVAAHILQALYSVFAMLLVSGQKESTAPFLARIDELGVKYRDRDLLVAAWVEFAHTFAARELLNDPWKAFEHSRACVNRYAAAGAREYVAISRAHLALSHLQLGMLQEAETLLDRVSSTPESGKLALMYATFYKGRLCLETGRLDSAIELAKTLATEALEAHDYVMLWCARLLEVGALVASDKLDEAGAALDELGESNAFLPFLRTRFLSLRSIIHCKQGRLQQALRDATDAQASGQAGPKYNYGKDPLGLRYALILDAVGDRDKAREVIRQTRDELLTCAAKIPDETVRKSYLENIANHARTMALAREWLGD